MEVELRLTFTLKIFKIKLEKTLSIKITGVRTVIINLMTGAYFNERDSACSDATVLGIISPKIIIARVITPTPKLTAQLRLNTRCVKIVVIDEAVRLTILLPINTLLNIFRELFKT
jgi:hypothetical protein